MRRRGGERNGEERGEARKRFFRDAGVVVVRPRYFTRAAQVEAHAERQGQRQVDSEASGPHASVGFARVCAARVVGMETGLV